MLQLTTQIAHQGEVHVETATGLYGKVMHQPTWIGLLIVAAVLVLVYGLTKVLKLLLPGRLLAVVATMILVGILYLPHNASVSGIILSAGFIITFLLTFTLLGKR